MLFRILSVSYRIDYIAYPSQTAKRIYTGCTFILLYGRSSKSAIGHLYNITVVYILIACGQHRRQCLVRFRSIRCCCWFLFSSFNILLWRQIVIKKSLDPRSTVRRTVFCKRKICSRRVLVCRCGRERKSSRTSIWWVLAQLNNITRGRPWGCGPRNGGGWTRSAVSVLLVW